MACARACSGALADVCCLTPPAPPVRSATKNIQTQSNGFGTFLQKFQTVTH